MRPVRKFFITLLIYFGSAFLTLVVGLFINSFFPWLDKYEIVLTIEFSIMILVKMD